MSLPLSDPTGVGPWPQPDLQLEKKLNAIAWAVWLAMIGYIGYVLWTKLARVSIEVYRVASVQWLNGQNIYTLKQHGYHYPPPSVVFYLPFVTTPVFTGEMIQRLLGMTLLAVSFYLLSGKLHRDGTPRSFWLFTLLTASGILANARDGQMNLPMTALMILAAVTLLDRRWWTTTVLLSLAFMAKPLALIYIGFVGLFYFKHMWWRLLIAGVVCFALPFATQEPEYVWWQYQMSMREMSIASEYFKPGFNDIRAIVFLDGWGWNLNESAFRPVRAIIGLGLISLSAYVCWFRKWDNIHKSMFLFAMASLIICPYNPRAEGNTYLLLRTSYIVYLVWAVYEDYDRKASWFLLIPTLGVMFPRNWLDDIAGEYSCHWIPPLTGVIFNGYLIYLALRSAPHARTLLDRPQPSEQDASNVQQSIPLTRSQ